MQKLTIKKKYNKEKTKAFSIRIFHPVVGISKSKHIPNTTINKISGKILKKQFL
jgi:hypothetical protein